MTFGPAVNQEIGASGRRHQDIALIVDGLNWVLTGSRWTRNRCIWSKTSRYSLDRGRVEFGAHRKQVDEKQVHLVEDGLNSVLTGSRWKRNRCIWSKTSRYSLDRGRVELGANATFTGSRWMSNNYITRCHRQVQLVGVSQVGDKML